MTIEEAGEIILEGHPWVGCPTCLATGIGAQSTEVCNECCGFRRVIRTPHRYACSILGIDLPRRDHNDMDALRRTDQRLRRLMYGQPGISGKRGAVVIEEYDS